MASQGVCRAGGFPATRPRRATGGGTAALGFVTTWGFRVPMAGVKCADGQHRSVAACSLLHICCLAGVVWLVGLLLKLRSHFSTNGALFEDFFASTSWNVTLYDMAVNLDSARSSAEAKKSRAKLKGVSLIGPQHHLLKLFFRFVIVTHFLFDLGL